MTMKRAALLVATVALFVGTGCAGDDDASGAMRAPAAPDPPAAHQPEIEESDLFKLDGNHLYVQNPTTGFNVLDVTNPEKPRKLGNALSSGGTGSEMYIRGNQAIVLLKTSSEKCVVPKGLDTKGWAFSSQVLIVDHTSKTHPKVLERYCLPGQLVASRTVDQVLYLVQTNGSGSRAISLDISSPTSARLVKQVDLPNAGKEIEITPNAIFVASRIPGKMSTTVTYIEIGPTGAMATRGTTDLDGQPQGRFHMQAHGDQFRIVTYNSYTRTSILHVLDVSNPDEITLLGWLDNIGIGEKLYATRFDGDRAYVVTFRQTDPLWIISLEDPKNPAIIGELHVPGWSDFIFPRGDRLITVGRGDAGGSLGLSLFDVSDPTSPRSVDQISLGDWSTKSEANVDHRAVTILDPEGQNPIVVVPHSVVSYKSSCQLLEMLRFVEVMPDRLQSRGQLQQTGTIRRTFMIKSSLFSISDEEVLSVDIGNLDSPAVNGRVTVGDGTAQNPNAGTYSSYCNQWNDYNNRRDYVYEDDSSGGYPFMWKCSVPCDRQGTSLPPVMMLVGLLWLGVWVRRQYK
jgi:hypothetical protein